MLAFVRTPVEERDIEFHFPLLRSPLPTSMTRTHKKGLRYISQAEEALADGENP